VATAKHFPGHGDTSVDSHLGLPIITRDLARLESVELPPFASAISAGVDCIMTAHISVPALDSVPDRPATLSPDILQGLLREQMGFDGLIATDSLGMRALTNRYDLPTATALAFQAGADLLLFGYDPGFPPSEQRVAYEAVLNLVKEVTVSESRLDESVRRILLVKAKRGILDWQPADLDGVTEHVGTAEHLAAARKVALDSITLVRDERGLLPLSPESSILVIYPRGGAGLLQAIRQHAPSATGLEVGETPSAREIAQAVARADAVESVVVGTRNVLSYPQQAQLLAALGPERPLVAVALDSPYDLLSYPQVSTYLATYGRAPVSMEALALVLFGLEAPRGRLPVELPGLHPVGQESVQPS
jgi:beta-N-acetylhexosaminidase